MAENPIPERQEILAQLEKILGSDDFVTSGRSASFLNYVVRKTLDGEVEKLKGYTIGVEVFNKPQDFNPDTDASVRVEATRLRKTLALYYHGVGKDDAIVIKIPKGGYKPTYYYRDQLPASETPEAEDAAEELYPVVAHSRKLYMIMAYAVFFLLGLGLTTYIKIVRNTAVTVTKESETLKAPVVAVLPFRMIGDEETAKLGEDLTQRLIRNLSRFTFIKPLSFRDVQDYKNWEGQSTNIGKTLHVNYLLEGTVKKQDGKVRISLRMLDLRKTTHVWGFDKEYESSLIGNKEQQDEILGPVASQLASPYGVIHNLEQERIDDISAEVAKPYKCILDYYAYCNDKTADKHKAVRTCLEDNVKNNPKDSESWSYLSWIYGDEYRSGYNAIAGTPPQIRARDAAAKALEADLNSARAHQYMGIAATLNKDAVSARLHHKLAVELNPFDSEILADAAWNYFQIGDWETSRALALKAIEINPGHPRWYYAMLFAYSYQHGKYDDALFYALEYDQPDDLLAKLSLAVSYAKLKQNEKALEVARYIEKQFPDFIQAPRKRLDVWSFPEGFAEKMLEGARESGIHIPPASPATAN